MDANHCPGAVQFLFRLSTGEKYVHCGDMRFSPKLLDNPLLAAYRNCTAVYLDTTYCNPRFTFPPQASICTDYPGNTQGLSESCSVKSYSFFACLLTIWA